MKRKPRLLEAAGWREWLALPALGVPWIKAKLDTGARTSALHAWDIEPLEIDGRPWVEFALHPEQGRAGPEIRARAPLVGERRVMSSTGHAQQRLVISTQLVMGDLEWTTEVTLTRRDAMGFRMLLGRTAMRRRLLVDPGRSFVFGRRPALRPIERSPE